MPSSSNTQPTNLSDYSFSEKKKPQPKILLRKYQEEAVDAIWNAIGRGCRAPLVCAPTGSGKTVIIAEIIKRVISEFDTNVVVVVDTKELVKQNYDMFKKVYPRASVGIYSAGLGEKRLGKRVTFAGIQSIYRQGKKLKNIGLILIDESHKLSPKSTSMYQTFIRDLKTLNSNLVIVGFTATPYRMGQGLLTRGDNAIFEDIVYDIPIKRLIEEDYLCPLISKGGIGKIDLSNVSTMNGDYAPDELEKAADNDDLTRAAISEIIAYGNDRKSWLIFAAGINHAKHITEMLRNQGIDSYTVYGAMEDDLRDSTLSKYKQGHIKCVVNVNLLTTGFDYPELDMIVLLTATKSPNRYVQALGRGMRVAGGKTDCLVLDYGNNVMRLGPIDTINESIKNKGGIKEALEEQKEPKMKECPICRTILPRKSILCPDCGHIWEIREARPGTGRKPNVKSHKAYSGSILSDTDFTSGFNDERQWVEVIGILYSRHKGKLFPDGCPKPDTLRIDFLIKTLPNPIKLWLPFDHKGYIHDRALKYARDAGGTATTLDEALAECDHVWEIPTAIYIKKDEPDSKFWNVSRWRFGESGISVLRNQEKRRK